MRISPYKLFILHIAILKKIFLLIGVLIVGVAIVVACLFRSFKSSNANSHMGANCSKSLDASLSTLWVMSPVSALWNCAKHCYGKLSLSSADFTKSAYAAKLYGRYGMSSLASGPRSANFDSYYRRRCKKLKFPLFAVMIVFCIVGKADADNASNRLRCTREEEEVVPWDAFPFPEGTCVIEYDNGSYLVSALYIYSDQLCVLVQCNTHAHEFLYGC